MDENGNFSLNPWLVSNRYLSDRHIPSFLLKLQKCNILNYRSTLWPTSSLSWPVSWWVSSISTRWSPPSFLRWCTAVSSTPPPYHQTNSTSTTALQSSSTSLSWSTPVQQYWLYTRSLEDSVDKLFVWRSAQEKYLYLLPWLVCNSVSVLLEILIFFFLLSKVQEVGNGSICF